MSILIIDQFEDAATLITDTLVVTGEDEPFGFRTKLWALPHLNMVMVVTGSAEIGELWYAHLCQMTTVRNVEDIDAYAPSILRAIHAYVTDRDGYTGHTTVRHFGFPPDSDRLVQYVYSTQTESFRTSEIFDSAAVRINGLSVQPFPRTEESTKLFHSADTAEKQVRLAHLIQQEQDSLLADGGRGVAIGGELFITIVENWSISTQRLERLPGYESDWAKIRHRAVSCQTPDMTTETRDQPPTDDQVREAFASYLRDRAENRVLLAKSADVSFDDGVVTVILYPGAAVPDASALMALSPFKNHAEFAGIPIAFENDEGRWLRQVVKRVDTKLADGTNIGSMTAAELYAMGTGSELPAS